MACRRLPWLALLLWPWVAPAEAGATFGGPSTIEVLGYEPLDARVYLLETQQGEAGTLPQLLYLPLLGPEPHRPVRVRSWTSGESTAAEAAFPERLARLRARLQPLPGSSADGIAVMFRDLETRPCTAQDGPVSPALQRTATELQRGRPIRSAVELPAPETSEAPGKPSPPVRVRLCRITHVTVRWEGHQAERLLETWGALTLAGAWLLPDPGARLVVLRHLGHTEETGYAEELPVLLRAAPGDMPTPPGVPDATTASAAPNAARHARCAASLRHATPLGDRIGATEPPGRWVPALTPAGLGLDAGWTRATLRPTTLAGRPLLAAWVTTDDAVHVALGQPLAEGGACLLGTWGLAAGGLGVDAEVVELLPSPDGEAVLVAIRSDAQSRGYRTAEGREVPPRVDRRWTLLGATPAGTVALPLDDRPAARLSLRWRADGSSRSVEVVAVSAAGDVLWRQRHPLPGEARPVPAAPR
ncbi:MAG: hypothetical protein RBU45_19310 [Myxococcota bacterium]|jgi:hypothetical protein|nr:hypothetical protein [Myxococcota bacterium]